MAPALPCVLSAPGSAGTRGGPAREPSMLLKRGVAIGIVFFCSFIAWFDPPFGSVSCVQSTVAIASGRQNLCGRSPPHHTHRTHPGIFVATVSILAIGSPTVHSLARSLTQPPPPPQVISLLGAVGGASCAFVMPSIAYMQVYHPEKSLCRRLFCTIPVRNRLRSHQAALRTHMTAAAAAAAAAGLDGHYQRDLLLCQHVLRRSQ